MPLAQREASVLLCVLLDGVGYDLVSRHRFLADVLQELRPLRTVLGYSCAAQPSILTGKRPVEHGGFSMYYRSRRSVYGWTWFLPFLPRRIAEPLIRRIPGITRRLHGLTGYFSPAAIPVGLLRSFQLFERRCFYFPRPLPGTPTLLDEVRAGGGRVCSNHWSTPAAESFAEAGRRIRAQNVDLCFLYVSGPDGLLHAHLNNEARVKSMLDELASRIRVLYETAQEHYRQVRLVILSDHGMFPVKELVDVRSPVDRLPYRLGHDYLAFYDATMARFWFERPGVADVVRGVLASIPHTRILSDEELAHWGALFPDHRYGETILIAEAGVVFSPCFFGDLTGVQGMHGYLPDTPNYEAFLGCAQCEAGQAACITDVYALLRELLTRDGMWR